MYQYYKHINGANELPSEPFFPACFFESMHLSIKLFGAYHNLGHFTAVFSTERKHTSTVRS